MTSYLSTTDSCCSFWRMVWWPCFWLGALVTCFPLAAQEADRAAAEQGKILFISYCAACHNRSMKDDLTGPALAGVEERWADYPREDLYEYIRNSQAAREAGHTRALQLWEEWAPTLMNDFDLTEEQIESILTYIRQVEKGTYGSPVGAVDSPDPTSPASGPLVINVPLGRNKSQLGSHRASLQGGSIGYTWPEKMVVGKVERIIVRIVKGDVTDPDSPVSAEAFTTHPAGGDNLVLDALDVGDIMTVKLFNPEEDPDDPFFDINDHEPEDLAARKQIEAAYYAEWNFSVKALREGQAPLKLMAYIREDDSASSRERPVFEASITILASRRQLQVPFLYLVGALGIAVILFSFRKLRNTTRMIKQLDKQTSASSHAFTKQQRSQIRELLKHDQLEEALSQLAEHLAGSAYENEIDLLIARNERLQREYRNNLITEEAAGVGRSKILESVMTLAVLETGEKE